jgi:gamma-glutamyltranspeptidase
MLGNPDYSAIFAPKGRLLREGDLIRRTNYSNTLFTIARHGPSAFYKGPIADALVSKIRSSGGILTHADLERYEVKVDKALEGTYFGRKVYTAHAPASGPVILQMFNLMEHYGTLREDGRTGVNVHRFVEAMKCKLLDWVVIALLILCSTAVGFAARYGILLLRHVPKAYAMTGQKSVIQLSAATRLPYTIFRPKNMLI